MTPLPVAPIITLRREGASLIALCHRTDGASEDSSSTLADMLTQARDDDRVKAVVIALGHDAGSTLTEAVAPGRAWLRDLINLEKPVIAAVLGPCEGLAFEVMLAADFIMMADSAHIRVVAAEQGVVPELSALWLLPRSVGRQVAKDIILSGRSVPAQEALMLGLATELCPAETVLARACEIASRFHNASTLAFGATKSLLNRSLDLDQATMAELESFAQAAAMDSDYHRDAGERFRAKQPCSFHGRTQSHERNIAVRAVRRNAAADAQSSRCAQRL